MSNIYIQKAKLRNFTALYQAFFDALNKDKNNWFKIKLEKTQETSKVSLQRAFSIHILKILFSRLSATARTGSISTLFQTQWNPLVLEVLSNGKLLGSIFLTKQSENVFQINVISNIKPKPNEWADVVVFTALKKYVKQIGATRLIIRSINEETKKTLKLSGFEVAFYDDVLYLDIS